MKINNAQYGDVGKNQWEIIRRKKIDYGGFSTDPITKINPLIELNFLQY